MTLAESNLNSGGSHSDKGDEQHTFGKRSYLDVYEPLFSPLKDEAFDLLEIGVHQGGSMRLWKTYFSKARLHGIDIDPDCKKQEDKRTTVTIGSQDNLEVLNAAMGNCFDIRIAIDDGSHLLAHMLASFEAIWPRISSRGFYIMEDVSTTYWGVDMNWAGMKYNLTPLPMVPRSTLNDLLLQKIEDMDYRRGDLLSLRACSNLLIFEKV